MPAIRSKTQQAAPSCSKPILPQLIPVLFVHPIPVLFLPTRTYVRPHQFAASNNLTCSVSLARIKTMLYITQIDII